jgi:hypothetical protein
METQQDFLFAEGPAPELHLPDPRSSLFAEVAACWEIPVGQLVRVELGGHHFAELRGSLELARAPDIPFDRRQPLTLRIGGIEFSSRQIVAWSLG